MEPGDLLLWTLFTVHGSAANVSDYDRRFMINSYVRAGDSERGEWAFRSGVSTPLGAEPQICKYEQLRETAGTILRRVRLDRGSQAGAAGIRAFRLPRAEPASFEGGRPQCLGDADRGEQVVNGRPKEEQQRHLHPPPRRARQRRIAGRHGIRIGRCPGRAARAAALKDDRARRGRGWSAAHPGRIGKSACAKRSMTQPVNRGRRRARKHSSKCTATPSRWRAAAARRTFCTTAESRPQEAYWKKPASESRHVATLQSVCRTAKTVEWQGDEAAERRNQRIPTGIVPRPERRQRIRRR